MEKSFTKIISLLIASTLIIGIFVGCGNSETTKAQKENNNDQIITAIGSSALQPLVEETAKNFKIKNPQVTINVQGGGSGAGINQVSEGTADIGNSDVLAEKKLKDKTKLAELIDNKVCGIGFAMVVSKDVKVNSLTKEQIQKIFIGEITNWKQVGGEDKEISLINRSFSSGSRAAFLDKIMEGKKEKESLGITQDSSGAVKTAFQSTKGAISYLALPYITEEIKKDIKLLKIDDVEPTIENIIQHKYDFWSYEHMYTKGEGKKVVKDFIDYTISEENSNTIEKLGYIPMKNLK